MIYQQNKAIWEKMSFWSIVSEIYIKSVEAQSQLKYICNNSFLFHTFSHCLFFFSH